MLLYLNALVLAKPEVFIGLAQTKFDVATGECTDATTRKFVTDLLVRVFELPEPEAESKMLATHTGGKVVVARLPATLARARIEQAREQARAYAFPLWISVEPI